MFKECPGCTVMTEKTHGCNKISCENCKTRWCFYCGKKYPTSKMKKKKVQDGCCLEQQRHKHLQLVSNAPDNKTYLNNPEHK